MSGTDAPSTGDTLTQLGQVLVERRQSPAASSYVASLYAAGTDTMLKKVGEEAAEVLLAGKSGDQAALVHEVADLWFHTLVLLASRDLGPGHVLAELQRRMGRSGLDEKASRLPK